MVTIMAHCDNKREVEIEGQTQMSDSRGRYASITINVDREMDVNLFIDDPAHLKELSKLCARLARELGG